MPGTEGVAGVDYKGAGGNLGNRLLNCSIFWLGSWLPDYMCLPELRVVHWKDEVYSMSVIPYYRNEISVADYFVSE